MSKPETAAISFRECVSFTVKYSVRLSFRDEFKYLQTWNLQLEYWLFYVEKQSEKYEWIDKEN